MTVQAHYIDRCGTLGALERTPQGGYRVPATLARVGIMGYGAGALRRQGVTIPEQFQDHDTIRILLPAEVLKAAVVSVADAPVTNEHPPQFITPDNFKTYAAGNVSAGTVEFDGEFLRAKLSIQDAKLISDIELGKRREVSMGYVSRTRFEAGTWNGQAYDAVRMDAEYNHTAVTTKARAGEAVCLALDSAEIPNKDTKMAIKVKGKDVEGEEAVQAVVDGYEEQLAAKDAEIAALKETAQEAETKAQVADSDEAFQAKLTEHLAKQAAERARAERLAKVQAAYPKLTGLDSKPEAYIDGLFAAMPAADEEGLSALQNKDGSVPAVVKDSKETVVAPPARKLSVREQAKLANQARIRELDRK